MFGPLTPQDWQQRKAMTSLGPWNQFRIIGDSIKFNPAPSAGQHCYFEFLTKNWCVSDDGLMTRSRWGNDNDIPYLDEELLTLGTLWRWKKEKGLEYAEDFNSYERLVIDAIGRDAGKDWIDLGGSSRYEIEPIVLVPSGSWNL